MPTAETLTQALTTVAAVKAQLPLAQLDSGADELLGALILAATRRIEQHCGRDFGRAQESEAVIGLGGVQLMLGHTPVVAVDSVLYQNDPVIGWTLSDPDAGFLELTTGWTDTRGWGFGLAEQRPLGWDQASYVVNYTGGFLLPSDDLSSRTISAEAAGQRYLDSASGFPLLAPGDRILAKGFAQPSNNGWKTVVSATAGAVVVTGEPLVDEAVPGDADAARELVVRTLPQDVEQACIETVKAWWLGRDRDPGIGSMRVGDASVTYDRTVRGIPFAALGLLGPWERVV